MYLKCWTAAGRDDRRIVSQSPFCSSGQQLTDQLSSWSAAAWDDRRIVSQSPFCSSGQQLTDQLSSWSVAGRDDRRRVSQTFLLLWTADERPAEQLISNWQRWPPQSQSTLSTPLNSRWQTSWAADQQLAEMTAAASVNPLLLLLLCLLPLTG